MPTCLDEHWPLIIEQCKKRVELNGSAGIKSVIDALVNDGRIPYTNKIAWYEEEMQTLAAQICKTNEYIHVTAQHDTYIFQNPNHALSLSQIQTNESFRTLNDKVLPENFKSQDKSSKRSLLLAAISTLFIAVTIGQQFLNTTDQELQGIKLQLQKTEKALEGIQLSLEKIDSSMNRFVRDTASGKIFTR